MFGGSLPGSGAGKVHETAHFTYHGHVSEEHFELPLILCLLSI